MSTPITPSASVLATVANLKAIMEDFEWSDVERPSPAVSLLAALRDLSLSEVQSWTVTDSGCRDAYVAILQTNRLQLIDALRVMDFEPVEPVTSDVEHLIECVRVISRDPDWTNDGTPIDPARALLMTLDSHSSAEVRHWPALDIPEAPAYGAVFDADLYELATVLFVLMQQQD